MSRIPTPQLQVRKARWVDAADARVTRPWWFKVICAGVTVAHKSAHDGREALTRGLTELETHDCQRCTTGRGVSPVEAGR